MPRLNHNIVKSLIVTAAKAVADSTYPVVAFGEPDPQQGETALALTTTTFARVDSITTRMEPRRSTDDVHGGTITVTVLVFGNGLGGTSDIEADLTAMVAALDQVVLRNTAASVLTEINLQHTGTTEMTPPSEARCDRLVALTFEGNARAEVA
jgi:hypothetical protein